RSILGIIPAVDIGEDGQPVDAGFTFPPDTPQITLVAVAGEITGSAMDLTWFQVTDEGDVELFTHTVELGSFQAAFSVGTNPGTLTSGTYRVDATLEGESLSTTFQVKAPEGAAAIPLRAGAGVASAIGQDATSGPPASGTSGAVNTPFSEASESDAAVELMVFDSPVDYYFPRITIVVRTDLPGGDGRVEARAMMGGSTRTVSFEHVGGLSTELDFNPCAHPGGSDLPGTEAEFSVSLFEGESSESIAGEQILTVLGPDETPPDVTINSDPPNRSHVEPGDEIALDATALEHGFATWQEGLNTFKLLARPGGQIGDVIRSTAGSAQPCGNKQWSLTSQATYTVPDDAPAVIKICGEALDFAGNFSEPDACNEYYTEEVAGALSGVTGSYVIHRDITTDSGGGYVETDTQITQLFFNLVAVGGNRLEGQGSQSFDRDYSYAAPTECPLATGSASVEWDVSYEGVFEVNSDGTIRVQFTGTPRYGPDFVYTYSIPGCEENNSTATVSGHTTVDFDVTLVDGTYYYRDDHDLDGNQTGEDYAEVTVQATY
ncbi:MAG: hypothetical protein ABI785_13240, partial [Gemmatimonadales bacterium]